MVSQRHVLIVYDDHSPQTLRMSFGVAEGVSRVHGVAVERKGISQANRDDLLSADALAIGSPNWSGVTGYMKRWLDDQGDLWEEGLLNGKIGGAFTTSRGRSSGVEFTLLTLLHWMLACGMVVVGLPWSNLMKVSSSYYGAIGVDGVREEDLTQARNLGERLARLVIQLDPH